MAEKLSPKMQKMVDELASGKKVLTEIHGKFETFNVKEDGGTWLGKRVDPTAKALIARGILVRDEQETETLIRWVLASAPAVETETVEEAPAEVIEEAPVITVEQGDKVARGGLKGKVLEVCTRAGVMLAAVAFGFDLVWVKVAELSIF